jgi:hypothetical protein
VEDDRDGGPRTDGGSPRVENNGGVVEERGGGSVDGVVPGKRRPDSRKLYPWKRPGSGGLSNVVGLPDGTSSRAGAYFHVGERPREKAGGSSRGLSFPNEP